MIQVPKVGGRGTRAGSLALNALRNRNRSGLSGSGWIESNACATGAMFDLAIDSKLRGCDVVKVKIGEIASGGRVRSRAIVIQQKTGRPVQFALMEAARGSLLAWLECRAGTIDDYAFPSRINRAPTISAPGSMPGLLTSG
jgi:hypothetical protein